MHPKDCSELLQSIIKANLRTPILELEALLYNHSIYQSPLSQIVSKFETETEQLGNPVWVSLHFFKQVIRYEQFMRVSVKFNPSHKHITHTIRIDESVEKLKDIERMEIEKRFRTISVISACSFKLDKTDIWNFSHQSFRYNLIMIFKSRPFQDFK